MYFLFFTHAAKKSTCLTLAGGNATYSFMDVMAGCMKLQLGSRLLGIQLDHCSRLKRFKAMRNLHIIPVEPHLRHSYRIR